jgi:hypothetical protein
MEDIVSNGRPRADDLLPHMVERPGKLTTRARKAAGPDWRCPRRRHPLAVVIQTAYGPWLYWHGDPRDGWQCEWQDDLNSPTVNAWCNCPNTWTVDTLSPRTTPALAIG